MSAELRIKKQMLEVHEQRLVSLDERINFQTERGNEERVKFLNERKANVITMIEKIKEEISELEKNVIIEDVPENDVVDDILEVSEEG
jgi:hypothetical protein